LFAAGTRPGLPQIFKKNGMVLCRRGERIVRISENGRSVNVGDTVISSGRIFSPAGTRGVVIGLSEPFTNGRTTDIIRVRWPNREGPAQMKFGDLCF
jgi:hypothetical protein